MIDGVTIRQATKAGVAFWRVGGVADLSFPTSKTRRGRVQGDGKICPTLMANNQDIWKLEADEVKKYRIRKLTPRECWRLMGFSDKDFDKAAEVNSNTQLYAQAGNSIVVNVLEGIFREMFAKTPYQDIIQGDLDTPMPERPEEMKEEPDEALKAQIHEKPTENIKEEGKEMAAGEEKVINEAAGEKIIREFKEDLKDSDRVKLMGSINSGNFMIHIDDAVDILESVILRAKIG